MNTLEISNLSKSFGGVQAVDDVSIKVKSGEIISIIGPNGAGKTTVFNLISGIYTPDAGKIILEGEDITSKPLHIVTHKGVARTFQNIRLFKGLNVLENVMTANDPFAKYNVFDSLFSTPKKRADKLSQEKCMEFINIVGLYDFRYEKPENLPYGMQRKLEVARALATNPKVLMLDEPAAGLNPIEVGEFILLVQKIHKAMKLSIMIIEHRMQVVMELSKWIYVLNFGKMLAEGTPSDIQNSKEVSKAYIGEDENIENF